MRTFSEEHKRKLSEWQKGKKRNYAFSEEHCKNIGNAVRGRKASIETKQKMSENKRAQHAQGKFNGKLDNSIMSMLKSTKNIFVKELTIILTPLGYEREVKIGNYFVDFAHKNAMVIIESDGRSHKTKKQQAKDSERDFILKLQGWKIIRVQEW